jgi:hypothetical protein
MARFAFLNHGLEMQVFKPGKIVIKKGANFLAERLQTGMVVL